MHQSRLSANSRESDPTKSIPKHIRSGGEVNQRICCKEIVGNPRMRRIKRSDPVARPACTKGMRRSGTQMRSATQHRWFHARAYRLRRRRREGRCDRRPSAAVSRRQHWLRNTSAPECRRPATALAILATMQGGVAISTGVNSRVSQTHAIDATQHPTFGPRLVPDAHVGVAVGPPGAVAHKVIARLCLAVPQRNRERRVDAHQRARDAPCQSGRSA